MKFTFFWFKKMLNEQKFCLQIKFNPINLSINFPNLIFWLNFDVSSSDSAKGGMTNPFEHFSHLIADMKVPNSVASRHRRQPQTKNQSCRKVLWRFRKPFLTKKNWIILNVPNLASISENLIPQHFPYYLCKVFAIPPTNI